MKLPLYGKIYKDDTEAMAALRRGSSQPARLQLRQVAVASPRASAVLH